MTTRHDFVVLGGGILGLSLALELRARFPKSSILILEKELELGRHASGRNSGVVHAGLYYEPTSLKAKLSIEGAKRMREFCLEHQLPYLERGKLVLPVHESDGLRLKALFKRAEENQVVVEWVDERQISELEPTARSLTGQAIHSPRTAVLDPKKVLNRIYELLKAGLVEVRFGVQVDSVDPLRRQIHSGSEIFEYGLFLNCAGAFADRIAAHCGLNDSFRSIPFKGIYFAVQNLPQVPQKLLYPLPDLRAPFLGVHFTTNVYGELTLGPNAIPALGRENYRGLNAVDWGQLPASLLRLGGLYLKNTNGFRSLVHREMSTWSRSAIAAEARKMMPGFKDSMVGKLAKVGIRPQIYNLREKRLEMDFIIEKTQNEIHILNSISPGFTCALSFADFVVKHYVLEGSSKNLKNQATG